DVVLVFEYTRELSNDLFVLVLLHLLAPRYGNWIKLSSGVFLTSTSLLAPANTQFLHTGPGPVIFPVGPDRIHQEDVQARIQENPCLSDCCTSFRHDLLIDPLFDQ